jgi:hypothetical protein
MNEKVCAMHVEPIDLKIARDLLGLSHRAATDNTFTTYDDDTFPCRTFVRELSKMPSEQTLLTELGEDFPEEPFFDRRYARVAFERSKKVSR